MNDLILNLLDPIKVAVILPVIMAILTRAESVKMVTSKNAQAYVVAVALLVVLVPAYLHGQLVKANEAYLGGLVVSFIAFECWFYEYVIKNAIKLVAWLIKKFK